MWHDNMTLVSRAKILHIVSIALCYDLWMEQRWEKCTSCHGDGIEDATERECRRCAGFGKRKIVIIDCCDVKIGTGPTRWDRAYRFGFLKVENTHG